MRQNCTRSRPIALSLLCFVSAEITYGCTLDRFYRLKSPTPCVTDCVSVAQLAATSVFEYPTPITRGAAVIQVSRSALTPITLAGHSPFVPIATPEFQQTSVGVQFGCRFGTIPRGLDAGIRVGMALDVKVFTGGLAPFHVLQSGADRSFGVYDVAEVKLE